MLDWDIIFTNAFEYVTQDLTKFYGCKNPDEITPNTQAVLTGLSKLPFPVGIIDVGVDNDKYSYLQDNISQLIYYDLEKIGHKQIKYFGKISTKKDELTNALVLHFEISENDSESIVNILTKKFEYTGFPLNNGSYIQFTRYDIKKNLDKFYQDFHSLFVTNFNDYFMSQYNTEIKINFNELYKMNSDTVLPIPDLLVSDPRTILSLEKLQESIANIQLSPKVPQPVKDEFQRAKDLFVFSYFKYEFITLSVRSALFAYESAMKLRYIQSLNGKAVMKYDSEIVHEFTNPSHSGISDYLYQMKKTKNWQLSHILINDKKFPLTVKAVMKWLIKHGIPKWKLGLYDAASHIRNGLAHTEQQMILSESSATTLHNIAYDINEMFELPRN